MSGSRTSSITASGGLRRMLWIPSRAVPAVLILSVGGFQRPLQRIAHIRLVVDDQQSWT